MADHYFSGQPATPDNPRHITARIWGRELTFTTSAGVFSRDGLDKATAVFLNHSTPPEGGTLLDLGCGWGPIACALASAAPAATVWATDINERALDLTALNATSLDLAVHTALPDDIPGDLMFDGIWSNPPIRIGKQALHDMLMRWLPRLTPGGTARLVVGKDLGADSLQVWLSAHGWPADRVATDKGFRVLNVHRPTPT